MLDYYEKKLRERKKKWWEWHKENPQVWDKFKEYTFDAIGSGRRHYSHWAIVNRIRWNKEIETSGEDFKISNDYISFYARLFHAKYPEYDGFFKLTGITHSVEGTDWMTKLNLLYVPSDYKQKEIESGT